MELIGYARISTTDQNPEAQTDALTAAGCERTFVDHGVSGKLAKRPKLDAAMDYVRAGDVLVITKLDRLGRSVKNLIELAERLDKAGVGLLVLHQGIDTTTPTGKMLFHVLAAIAEFERDLISERTKDGLTAARARGRKGGRRPVLTPDKLATARTLVDGKQHTMQQIADVIGVSRASLYRALDEKASA
jgi:DNA invertase Pin-like site-specific DNA recombinase